jgi:ribosomal protein L6P/L9E
MGFHTNYLSFDQSYSNNKDQDLNFRFKNLNESKKSKDNLKFVKEVLSFYLGKSHNLLYEIPLNSITISKDILKTTGVISIFSTHLNYVSQIAATIKNYKKPDPYKGKGISFENFTFISKKEQKK